MKNFKIGTKIFIAFGTVIAFMLLSVLVIFFANTGIIDNVERISHDSELQTTGNSLKDEFLLARVVAIRLLSTTDAAVYNEFKAQAGNASKLYTEVYNIIAKDPSLEVFLSAFQKAESDFNAYVSKAGDLGKANELENQRILEMNAAGVGLAEYGNIIYLDQMELLNSEIFSGSLTTNSFNRRVARIHTGANISKNINQFRLYAREMMASFDTANFQVALDIIDETLEMLYEYNADSSIQNNIENSQMLIEEITGYRVSLVAFAEACDSAAKTASELTPLGAAALDSLSTAVLMLDSEMITQVDNTIASASSTLFVVLLVSSLSIVVAVILAFVIMRGITVPVKKMVDAADNIALGDTNVDVRFDAKDEIGMLSTSFKKMLDGIKAQIAVVEKLADGDLTVEIIPRSDKDTMGIGLRKMLENLNDMFNDINISTLQVATSSKQIADGSQSLAQGSTEQASAVQQLSSSISEIADKTIANAELADKAAKLAGTIKDNAEEGSRQMGEMMTAVSEINEASQNINKVIKVIDDIAFKTNILALNAAVEAARAGQHGKGFAVVADEVRNLAAKSADAAKDTSGLIANSMVKAELGARIAGETAASLDKIVSGINESSMLVDEIARSSEEQSESITQINKGIDQVAQVVQQNSATAEQSAAASEEMNSQANILEELVSHFKLKDSNSAKQRSLPSRTKTVHRKDDTSENIYNPQGAYGKY